MSDELKVAMRALADDADIWIEAADGLGPPVGSISGLELSGGDDVMKFGADIGLDRTYNETIVSVVDLLNQARAYFVELSDTLIYVKENYEREEHEIAEEFRGR
jgi:hypothetical protein